jgi:L-2-hydroxyglutarate oxidase LhgO
MLGHLFVGFIEKGSVWVAQTSDRLHTLKRQYAIIKSLGINCDILSLDKIKEKIPMMDPKEIWVTHIVSIFICAKHEWTL